MAVYRRCLVSGDRRSQFHAPDADQQTFSNYKLPTTPLGRTIAQRWLIEGEVF